MQRAAVAAAAAECIQHKQVRASRGRQGRTCVLCTTSQQGAHYPVCTHITALLHMHCVLTACKCTCTPCVLANILSLHCLSHDTTRGFRPQTSCTARTVLYRVPSTVPQSRYCNAYLQPWFEYTVHQFVRYCCIVGVCLAQDVLHCVGGGDTAKERCTEGGVPTRAEAQVYLYVRNTMMGRMQGCTASRMQKRRVHMVAVIVLRQSRPAQSLLQQHIHLHWSLYGCCLGFAPPPRENRCAARRPRASSTTTSCTPQEPPTEKTDRKHADSHLSSR
jgi:hypothetical protein